ncbi:hypothetical protein BDB01DRAFT_775437 [Pilobolus umbonatus]|nr:hypothetical protein BDB01DRAFT_775437 [Pilobolus umbonatus]
MTDNSYYHELNSPTTEILLYNFLKPGYEKQPPPTEQPQSSTKTEISTPPHCSSHYWDDSLLSIKDDKTMSVKIVLRNFTDLQAALNDIDPHPNSRRLSIQKRNNRISTTEEDLMSLASSYMSVPPSIGLTVINTNMLDVLMNRSIQHWCCIGFKVAPVSIDLVKNWRKAPISIVYCIASISLVTFMDKHTSNAFTKQAAMAFYEQAKSKMDDIVSDRVEPLSIQSYFCLSYTSNLLRLYEQQRTWGGLASISLQHIVAVKQNEGVQLDKQTLNYWFRWYYVDAWICLTLNRDCLLPDSVAWIDLQSIQELSKSNTLEAEQHSIYCFVVLGYFMRKYIRALHSGKLFHNNQSHNSDLKSPSSYYYEITHQLTEWYESIPVYSFPGEFHLKMCYYSMRLVVLYQFLSPYQAPPYDILIDCLETNMELLMELQRLKEVGCDQSTYHYMFFAIHNSAKRIYQYQSTPTNLRTYAEEQLKINLMLLKSTQAYAHDVFKMRLYAGMIEDQFHRMNIICVDSINIYKQPTSTMIVFKQHNDQCTLRNRTKKK